MSYCSISPSGLLDLCSACPQLNSLSITQDVPNIECADLDKLAVSLNQLCPMLEAVNLPTKLTPAETYARHFPRLRRLSFKSVVLGSSGHTPNRFDVIAQAAENCVRVTEIELLCNPTPALVEMLAGTPLRDRVTQLLFSFAPFQRVSSCIQALGAFPNLHELSFGLGDSWDLRAVLTTDFCEHLASECPMLRKLKLRYANNECMRVICQRLPLEDIAILDHDKGEVTEGLTADVIDIMLASPCATSLREAYIYGVYAFGTVELLRLVEGCPNMVNLHCNYRPRSAAYCDALNLASLRRLLKSRGGKLGRAKAAKFPTRARLTPLSDR